MVVAKVDTFKYPGYALQISEIAPQKKMIPVYRFGTKAVVVKRQFSGITTSRPKVVECHNLSRFVITAGVYLKPDDYDTIR